MGVRASGAGRRGFFVEAVSRGAAACFFFFLSFSATLQCQAQGSFALVGGSVSDIDNSGNVNFTLQFSYPPDFFSCDAGGRQANGFQFYIGTTTNVPQFYPPRPYASLIRGGEIYLGNGIAIRNDGPPDDGEPNSGGWGAVRGTVPFSLNGSSLTFAVPAAVLNVQGSFAYSLLLTSYGGATHSPYTGASGGDIPLPEPAVGALVTLAILSRWVLRKNA